MKPLPFDMTPLAQALKASRKKAAPRPPDADEPEAPAATVVTAPEAAPPEPVRVETQDVADAPERTVAPDGVIGRLPQSLLPEAGWLTTLAEEQMHALATHVVARHTEQGLRSVAVTSALAGEGKTSVSLNLARRLATAGLKVLIIDLDLYRATLSRASQLEEMTGAVQASAPVNGRDPFLVYPTDFPDVSILPAGTFDPSEGVPLMSPDRIQRLIRRGLETHDLVLLDCPPLLPVADTYVIGDVVDSAILVVRAGSTPREVLDQAIREFGKEKFSAAVLNRAQPRNIPYFREVYGYYRRRTPKQK